MRDLSGLPGPFHAVLIMWQSFGYFDAGTNLQVLHQVASALRPGGRLVLDLYHRGFFEARPGSRMLQGNGRDVKETRCMNGDRLHVALAYDGGESESMEWQVFYPQDIVALAEVTGFRAVMQCCQWQESRDPSPDHPRMQIVLRRL